MNEALAVTTEDDIEDLEQEYIPGVASTGILQAYIARAARFGLLSAEDEVLIATRIEVGQLAHGRHEDMNSILSPESLSELEMLVQEGETAKETMVLSNLKLVIMIAKRYQNRGLELVELIQHGNIGLIKAVEMFDHARGFKFSTYAFNWIQQSIRRGLANEGRGIRIPVHEIDETNKVFRQIGTFSLREGRDPSDEELAAELGVTVEKVRARMRNRDAILSLSMPIGESGDEFGEILEDPDSENTVQQSTVDSMIAQDLHTKLSALPDRDRLVLTYKFGLFGTEPMSPGDIAKVIGMSESNVANLIGSAMAKLRHPSLQAHVINTDSFSWRDDALCAEVGLEPFFPLKGGSTKGALRICDACEVTETCLDDALETGEKFGIRGGVAPRARVAMIRARDEANPK